MLFKIGVLKKFCYIHRKKSVLESLFNKIIKTKLKQVFPVKNAKFLRIPFSPNASRRLLLSLSVIIPVIPKYYQKSCGSFLLFLDLIAFNLHFLHLLFDRSKINQNQNIYFNPLIQPPLSN